MTILNILIKKTTLKISILFKNSIIAVRLPKQGLFAIFLNNNMLYLSLFCNKNLHF